MTPETKSHLIALNAAVETAITARDEAAAKLADARTRRAALDIRPAPPREPEHVPEIDAMAVELAANPTATADASAAFVKKASAIEDARKVADAHTIITTKAKGLLDAELATLSETLQGLTEDTEAAWAEWCREARRALVDELREHWSSTTGPLLDTIQGLTMAKRLDGRARPGMSGIARINEASRMILSTWHEGRAWQHEEPLYRAEHIDPAAVERFRDSLTADG